MAVERSTHYEQMSFEAYLALIAQDSEHAYEYLDGRVYMMTGGSPDHAIIGSNLNGLLLQTANAANALAPLRPSERNGLLQNFLRGRRCIVYNSDVYVQLCEHYRVCPDV